MSSRPVNPGPLILICVAFLLALLLGVAPADPASFRTLLWGASLGVLAIPVLMRYHHILVLFLVNAPPNAFFPARSA